MRSLFIPFLLVGTCTYMKIDSVEEIPNQNVYCSKKISADNSYVEEYVEHCSRPPNRK